MPKPLHLRTTPLRSILPARLLVSAFLFAATLALTQSAPAQTFSVLHNFTGGADGGFPTAGLTLSSSGSFYGTTTMGGNPGAGVVYRLARSDDRWILTPLFTFPGGYYGSWPSAPVVFGPNGTLFGTTTYGGYFGNGTVFNLGPPPNICTTALCGWNNTVIYRYQGTNDGANPEYGAVVFDQQGNLYGTTSGSIGSPQTAGSVYKLTPENGGWTESVLFHFTSLTTGEQPYGGVIFDQAGHLYGTTYEGGGSQRGLVFQLTSSDSGWTENVLYNFQGFGDGSYPSGDLIFDPLGNLFGTTGGAGGSPGSVFELSPSGDSWIFSVVHTFTGPPNNGPIAGVVRDAAGNLYGATLGGAYGYGAVFKLTPDGNGTWTYTDLYDFFGAGDGADPYGKVTLDNQGNLFGTAWRGGTYGHGVIWEITP